MTIKRLAFLTILLTYLLIVFGGYVASSDSGMGCGPEWPKCNGDLVPVLKGATLIEYLHRIIGATLGLLSLLLFTKVLRAKAGHRASLVAFIMIGLLTVQVLLGALVVVRDLPSIIITIHLVIAMVFLSLLIWIWSNPVFAVNEVNKYKHISTKRNKSSVILYSNILLGLFLITLAFGAYSKHQSYGLACGWLGCRHSFLPTTIPEIVQTIHRGFAAASAIYVLLLTFRAFSKKWDATLRWRLLLCTLTVVTQLGIGVVVIVTTIDIPWAVLHLAVATALFAFICELRIYAGNVMKKSRPTMLPKEKGQSGRRSLD